MEVKCRRLVDHFYAVFAFGSENWLWTVLTLDKIKGWETKGMLRLFRFKRQNRDMSRLSFKDMQNGLKDMDSDGFTIFCMKYLQKACGVPWDWVCDEGPNAAIDTLKMYIDGEAGDGGIPCEQNCRNVIQKIIQDGSISGEGTIMEMCGTKLLRAR